MCENKTKINKIETFLKYTWMGILLISGGGLIMLVSLLSIQFTHSNNMIIIIYFLGLIFGCVISLVGLNELRTAPIERKTDEKISSLSKGFEVKKR